MRQTQEVESQDPMNVRMLSEAGEEQQENTLTPGSGPRQYLHLQQETRKEGSPGLGSMRGLQRLRDKRQK